MKYLQPSFSVSMPNSKEYKDNWDAVFGPKDCPFPSHPTQPDLAHPDVQAYVDETCKAAFKSITSEGKPPSTGDLIYDTVGYGREGGPSEVVTGFDEDRLYTDADHYLWEDLGERLRYVATDLVVTRPKFPRVPVVGDILSDLGCGGTEEQVVDVAPGRIETDADVYYEDENNSGLEFADGTPVKFIPEEPALEPVVEVANFQRRLKDWSDYNFPVRVTVDNLNVASDFIERHFVGLGGSQAAKNLAYLLAVRDRGSWRRLIGAFEELGELAHAHLKQEQGIRGTKEEHMAAKLDALGDAFVYMCDYANAEGLSMEEAITKAWNEISTRDWIKYPTDGKTR